jgi:hypothetical protein
LVALVVAVTASAWVLFATARGVTAESPLSPDVPVPRSAHLQLTLSPRSQDLFSGDTAELTVTIVNTGGVTVSGLATTGSSFPNCNKGSLGALAPGQSTSYTCSRANVGDSSLEVLTVSGQAAGGGLYQQTANAFVKVSKPELIIIKRPTTQTVRPGGTARFVIVIRNEGPTPLANVKVIDPQAPDCGLDPAVPLNLGPGERREYSCSLPNVQAPVATVATVQGTNPGDNTLTQASDIGWVEVLNLGATLTAVPVAVDEPGGEVTFTARVINPGSIPLELVGLTTNKFGNLFDPGNELVPASTNECLPGVEPIAVSPNGGSVSCDFVALVSGQPSDFSVVLTALAEDATAEQVSATTSATVVIRDVPSVIEVVLSADPPIVSAPGARVTFDVRISNFSEADGVFIDTLTDSALGSLDGRGTCALPTPLITAGGSYDCSYSDQVNGAAGDERLRIVTASGLSDDPVPGPVSGSDSIIIAITDQPIQRILMPGVMDDVVEPNYRCGLAYPLQLNRAYHFLPPPTYVPNADPPRQDYYRFQLTESSVVTVELTNFVPLKGQLIVRKAENCDDPALANPIGRNPDSVLNRTLSLGTRPPGQYFIQIINDGPAETQQLYRLIVKTQ